ncbi:MAG: LacI family DNA-binding transcriptional regulator [Chloroflexota bacterium]|nr:LacI family DNA-binding transcriptional regulator [Chloroflexota bacterium]
MADEHNSLMAKPITIEDVARIAGVSVSTVSRILNDKPDVSEATRQRVRAVIEQLGYVPNLQAKSLAIGKSRMISLLFPMEHGKFTQLELDFFLGAASAASKRGYFLNLYSEPMDAAGLLKSYRGGQIDGAILMQIRMDDWRPPLLREHHHPFVMIGRCADNTGYSYVDIDFEAGLRLAFEHLIKLGHRHIGFIARPASMRRQKLGPAVRLLNGYLKACELFDIFPAYREADMTAEAVGAATRDLMDDDPTLTALITVSGVAATGAIRAFNERGRRVPQDMSVVALASNRVASLITPPLTAINFPTDTMGYRAAKMLIARLEGKTHETQHVLLAPELVIRESTISI